MRPPEKFQTVTRLRAADQRYEGWKPEPHAYLKGLDVRTMSGRRRDIFLDILFIEWNRSAFPFVLVDGVPYPVRAHRFLNGVEERLFPKVRK